MTTQGNFYKYTVDWKKTDMYTYTHTDSLISIITKQENDDVIWEGKAGMENTTQWGNPETG